LAGFKNLDVVTNLQQLFTNISNRVDSVEGDRIRIIIRHPDLQNPIVLPVRSNMTADDILKVIAKF